MVIVKEYVKEYVNMKKTYSTTYDRACHILLFAIDKWLAHDYRYSIVNMVRCGELSKVMRVSKPVVYEALNLLILWGHMEKVKEGRKTYYAVTDRGLSWVEAHEGYVQQRANINIATIEANKNE